MNANDAASLAHRLETLALTGGYWRRLSLVSMGGFFEFYDLFLAAYIVPGLVRSHLLATTTAAFFDTHGVAAFLAVFFLGLFLGTAVFGFLADRTGRRTIFAVSLLWYACATAIMAFQKDALSLDLWRFISGIGIGVELVTIDTYIAELTPAGFRGRAFAYANIVQFLAIPLVALLSWMLVPRSFLGVEGWRIVVLFGSVGALVVWVFRRHLPESPRWLAEKGQLARANQILDIWENQARLKGSSSARRQPRVPIQCQQLVAPIVTQARGSGPSKAIERRASSFLDLTRAPYRSRTVMLIIFNLFQAAGYYGFASWIPTLLIASGIKVTTSLGYTFIIALAAPVGPLLGVAFSDRIERKWIVSGAALAIALCGLAFAQAHGRFAIIACGVGLTLANNILSFSYHAYQPELFPTRLRARAVGFVYSFSRLSTMFSAFVVSAILRAFGAPGVFVFIATCMGLVAGVIAMFGPRTRDLPLEAISR